MTCPDLKIGTKVENHSNSGKLYLSGEVVSFTDTTIDLKVLHCSDKYYSRYLSVGNIYPEPVENPCL